MTHPKSPTDIALNLIRLSFPLPEEEQIAVALTTFLGTRADNRITELRPDMRMREVLDLGGSGEWTTAECSRMLELAGVEAFDDQFAEMSFREQITDMLQKSQTYGIFPPWIGVRKMGSNVSESRGA